MRQLTDESGAVTLAKSYQPYGDVLSSNGSAVSRYGFTGEWADVSGMVYLRARYYSPGVGRFAQADTLIPGAGNPLAWDRYAYALGNPLRYTDPTGHCAQDDDNCWRLADQLYQQFGWRIKGIWDIEDVRLLLEAGQAVATWFTHNGGGDAMGRLRSTFRGVIFAHGDFIGRFLLKNAHHVRGSTVYLLDGFSLDTVIHELGHVLDNRLGFEWPIGSGLFGGGPADNMAQTLGANPSACGWNHSRCSGYDTPDEEFPTFYAGNGPSEDFAESFRLSVLHGAEFQSSYPLRSRFLTELAVSLTETQPQYVPIPRAMPVPTPPRRPIPIGTPSPP